MKFYIFLILSCFIYDFSLAQKSDYVWVLGHNGGTILDFNSSPPSISFVDKDAEMSFTNASFCNSEGSLLFYTNGCEIYNAENALMDNGAGINPGQIHDAHCQEPFSAYSVPRGALILPLPDDTTKFYLFHQGANVVFQPILDVFVEKQYYSIIDMSLNNGLGKVIEKNKIVIQDTLQSGDLTAVKHKNGKDWWVIVPQRFTNKYYKTLFTSDGIADVFEQIIGDSTSQGSDGGGQAVFSPTGLLYVRYNPVNDIFLFDFDRETGLISNYRHIPVAGDSAFVGGAAISPNSRFLYISSETKFYQFDLEAEDIAASQVLLGEYDGYMSPFATTFFHAQLAPDCKIYITCSNSANVFHVINNPDEPGLACDFVQHGVQLATSNAFSIPNFPNYRLGVVPELPCVLTTSSESIVSKKGGVKVFPNPAKEEIKIVLPAPLTAPAEWRLFNTVGQMVQRSVVPTGQQEQSLSLAGVPPGLYFWKMQVEGRQVRSGKVVVAK